MKRFLLLFALVSFATLGTIQAQSCSHAKKATSTTAVDSDDAVAKAASLDETIERRVCEKSGNVSYWKKEVCEHSGNVSFNEVEYNSSEGKFVNVSPKDKASCSKDASATKTSAKGGKSCCAKGASAEKSCCAKGASSASCGSKKSASAVKSSTEVEPVKVKMVSDEGSN